jgi:predicted ATPase
VTRAEAHRVIRTPDQRLRVFVSSTLEELAPERSAIRDAIEALGLAPVMFETGARPHPPRDLYRAYLEQSHVFLAIYWQRYGFVADGEVVSGIEDEYISAGGLPKLVYVKRPAPDQEPRLGALLSRVRLDDLASYKKFSTTDELRQLVRNDLALLLSERFEASNRPDAGRGDGSVRHDSLPAAMTPILGRGPTVRTLSRLLVGDNARLVTLTGPGGVGKTRLAVEVGTRLRASFADGVVLVDLAPVSDPAQVAGTIAAALGVPRTTSGGPVNDIATHMAGRRLLLVLDNFEQVADAAPVLAEILSTTEGLRVLATSRRPLQIVGEHEFEVPPLSLPPAEPHHGVAAIMRFDAVRLFVRRAKAVDPRFALSAANADAVAEICRRLDGLPLAIELAAARTKLLAPAALLARLDSRLGLLTDGARDLPERQRTLRGTIDWSYHLLEAREQQVFAQVSTFAGGFDLAAAQAVSGPDEVLDALTGLVNASLVRTASQLGEARFDLLATIREYGLERLRDDPDRVAAHNRHAQYFRDLAEAAEADLYGPRQIDALRRMESNVDNLRAAVSWSLEHDRAEDAIRILKSTWLFWWLHGHVDEARAWTVRMVSAGSPLAARWRGWALSVGGAMAFASGDLVAAERLLEDAVRVFEQSDNHDGRELSMILLGQTLTLRGEFERAGRLLDDGLVLSRAQGNAWESAKQLNFRGQIPLLQGDTDRATEFFEQALRESRQVGERLLILTSLSNLALSRQSSGDLIRAEVLLDEGLVMAGATGDRASGSHFLDRLAALADARSDQVRADDLRAEAEQLREASGSSWLRAFAA